jgi:predicted kinase
MKKKELEVIINIGCPASGKSTYTMEFLAKNPNYVKVGRDDYRYMLRNQGFTEPKIEKMITDLVDQAILSALSNKLNVIVDNTSLKISSINHIIKLVHDYANVSYRVFDVPYKTLLERDAARDRSVGEPVLKRMWGDWVILKDSFDFQPVPRNTKVTHIVPNFKSDLPQAIWVDLDGTLALSYGRRDMFDWSKVDRDSLNEIVAEQVKFHKSMGRKVIIVSGRDEVSKSLTEDWLKFYDVEYDLIFMRPANNFEKDTVIKRRIYENEIKGKYNLICAYDDRKQVLDLLFDLEIFTFSCNQGNKIF